MPIGRCRGLVRSIDDDWQTANEHEQPNYHQTDPKRTRATTAAALTAVPVAVLYLDIG